MAKKKKSSVRLSLVEANLRLIGLTPTQIRVYLYLLSEGTSTPPQIARGTGILRTNCYNILRDLDDIDLIDRKRTKSRFVYIAQNPKAILRAMDRKRDAVDEIIPQLHDIYKVQKNKPTVEYYDGLLQVEDIFTQTLESNEIILSVESTKLLYQIDPDFFLNYDKELRKRQIFTRDLLSHDSGHEYAKKVKELQGPYYKYKFMPEEHTSIKSQILIWNNNVAHIAFEQPYFGTIMRSAPIANAMRSLFEMSWEGTPDPKED